MEDSSIDKQEEDFAKEKCHVCGKALESGEGRFREPDSIICVKCHGMKNLLYPEIGK